MLKLYFKMKYLSAGKSLGANLSYSYMGKWVGYDKQIKQYKKLEKIISKYGYLPIDLNNLIQKYGWGRDTETELVKAKSRTQIQLRIRNNQSILDQSEETSKINFKDLV